MHRERIGRYDTNSTGGELVRAFIPAPLPPVPPLRMEGSLQTSLEEASYALGRLDGVATQLSAPDLLIYSYVRKEAVLSSRIEGTQSSISDLLMFELDATPGVPFDDVVEVSNYVAALDHGLKLMGEGLPLCNRLLREIHGKLLSRGHGSTKMPGEFRRSQNWIGGSRPGNARYVPPPHTELAACMGDLERFLHARNDGVPALVRAGLAHAQFETIHPFLDGNGRVGRLLITLLLQEAGFLRVPILYLSLFFKEHRETYYELLGQLRHSGDWEAWLEFFLRGVKVTADDAVAVVQRLQELFRTDRAAVEQQGRRAGSALRVHEVLKEKIFVRLSQVVNRAEVDFSTASSAMELLTEVGIAQEMTGRRRGRVFAYGRYLAILNEGVESSEDRSA